MIMSNCERPTSLLGTAPPAFKVSRFPYSPTPTIKVSRHEISTGVR
jgi:hypothetical protein